MVDDIKIPETEQKGTGKIVSAGKPEPFKVNIPMADQIQKTDTPKTTEELEAAAADAELAKNKDHQNVQKTQAELDADAALNKSEIKLSDEDFKAEYEKRFPTKIEPTPEELKLKEDAFEKRMLDLYIETGGNIEQFALLKQIASADLTLLSKAELAKELKDSGITDEEHINAIQKERFYQIEQSEIDEIEDEDEKALAQKKLDYGKKKFEERGAFQKEKATEFFNTLREAVKEKDSYAIKESEFSSNVEEHFNKLDRTITLQLGKADDADIAPVNYEFPDSVIAEAKNVLKDITLRKQLLFNTDGTLNLPSIAELVLKSKAFDSAAKTAYLEGGSRQVDEFKKVFPFVDPKAIGVGGGSQEKGKGTGKLVSAGPPQRFNSRK